MSEPSDRRNHQYLCGCERDNDAPEVNTQWVKYKNGFLAPAKAVWRTTGSLALEPRQERLRAEANGDILVRIRRAKRKFRIKRLGWKPARREWLAGQLLWAAMVHEPPMAACATM